MRQDIHRYDVEVRWAGPASGDPWDYGSYSRSYSLHVPGKPVLDGSADPAFRGDPERHNPEDLFVAAVSACHMLTYLALCARRGIEVVRYADDAWGALTLDPAGGGRFTSIVLRPTVDIARASDRDAAEALHEKAHHECFLAASCSVPIRCEPRIVTISPETSP